MAAQSPKPVALVKRVVPHEKSREAVLRHASNEFVFAVVGHVGSGTTAIAKALENELQNTKLGGRNFQTAIIKARETIDEWAKQSG